MLQVVDGPLAGRAEIQSEGAVSAEFLDVLYCCQPLFILGSTDVEQATADDLFVVSHGVYKSGHGELFPLRLEYFQGDGTTGLGIAICRAES